jgi:biopolymer transport protein ExbB
MWSALMQGDAVSRSLMALLLGMSVASWVAIVWKTWLLHQSQHHLAQGLAVFWQAPSLAEAHRRVQAHPAHALLGALVHVAHTAHTAHTAASPTSTHPPHVGAAAAPSTLHQQVSTEQRLTRLLRQALDTTQQRFTWGQTWLATVGATAPFVGLLGTVWGIHEALIRIGAEQSLTLEQVAGPVGEALVMTAAGLAVALPAVVAYNLLGRRAAQAQAQLDAFAHDLRALVLEQPTGRC